MRLRRLHSGPLADDVVATDLWRVAVSSEGRRSPAAAVFNEVLAAHCLRDGLVPVLDHAGPAAALWSVERPLGPAAVKESVTGRLPLGLDDEGWTRVQGAFVVAAAWCHKLGLRPVIAVDDDGLLHAAVSPLMSHPPLPHRVRAIVAACAPCDLLLVVEDLAPGGLDPTAGVALARQLVDTAGATTLYATAGTVRLLPLKDRGKGHSVDVDGAFIASAAWCVGLGVPVVAVGASAASPHRLLVRSRALGLHGVVGVASAGRPLGQNERENSPAGVVND